MLQPGDKACRCGWKVPERLAHDSNIKPHIACAHESCGTSAVIREMTPTGWANFCLYHYEQFHQSNALVTYRKLGLERWPDETHQEHKRRVFDYINLMAKVPIKQREAA